MTFNVAKAHEDAPLKFIELIQLLRVARFESIEALWAQFKAKPDHRLDFYFLFLKKRAM